jgi:hypothetical protein
MPRQIDVQKVLLQTGESKFLNLDVSVGDLVRSDAFGSLVAFDDIDVICADWIMVFRKGPRRFEEIEVLGEIGKLAGSLRQSLQLADSLQESLKTIPR